MKVKMPLRTIVLIFLIIYTSIPSRLCMAGEQTAVKNPLLLAQGKLSSEQKASNPALKRKYKHQNLNSVLCIAVREGQPELVASVIEDGADPKYSNMLLTEAVYSENPEVLEILLQYFENQWGKDNALLEAIRYRRLDMISLLLENGANPKAIKIDYVGGGCAPQAIDTSVTLAAKNCDPEIMLLLLKKGADVNSGDSFGGRPVYFAAKLGNIECVKVLIEYGAELNDPGINNYSPLKAAKENGHDEIVKILLDAGAEE